MPPGKQTAAPSAGRPPGNVPGPPRSPRVCAIVVSYQPDPALLSQVLTALAPQVAHILVLDNATEPPLPAPADAPWQCRYHRCTANRGLAWTQNMGARWAWRNGFDAVLLMDQDSIPAPGMVSALLDTWAASAPLGPVAAVSPQPIDHASARRFPLVGDRPLAGHFGVAQVAFVIASGMLIPRAAWQAIGPMRTSLFIDHLDTEWCLRATAAGWWLLVDTRATLQHRLGNGGDWIWLGRRRWLPRHSPLRNYYMLRNALWLMGHAQAPMHQRAVLLARALAVVAMAVLLQPGRLPRLRKVAQAFRDGLAGRLGAHGCCAENATQKDYSFRKNLR